MGRKWKPGVEYFKINTNNSIAEKIIEAKYGLVGCALLLKLKQHIFKNDGYFLDWSKDSKLMFLIENNLVNSVTDEFLDEFIDECVNRGIFNDYVFENFTILTSLEIQEEYFFITQKRCYREIREEILLISSQQVEELNALNAQMGRKTKENPEKCDEREKAGKTSQDEKQERRREISLVKQAENILSRVLLNRQNEEKKTKEISESNKNSNHEKINRHDKKCTDNKQVSLIPETIPIEYINISKDIFINHGGKKTYFEDPNVNAAFLEFLTFRKSLHKPIYKSFVSMVIDQVRKLSNDNPDVAVKILRQSIVQGWTGLYPLDHGISNAQKPLKVAKQNTFNSFEQRDDDINAFAIEKLKARLNKTKQE